MAVFVCCALTSAGISAGAASTTHDVTSVIAPQASLTQQAKAVRLSMTASPSTLAEGRKVRLTGRVQGKRSGTRVVIQEKLFRTGGGWFTEGTTKVQAGGRYSYTDAVTHGNRKYRACAPAGRRLKCSKSRLVTVVAPRSYSVTAAASAPTVSVGGVVTITGAVTPADAGSPLRLWARQTDGEGAKVAAGRVGVGGTFTLTAPATAAGTWTYEVLKTKSALGGKAWSNEVRINVTKPSASLTVGSVTPTTLDAGQPVTVTGTASPNLVGKPVQLEVGGSDGTWTAAGSATVGADGRYTLSAPMTQAGKAVSLRVAAPETLDTAAATVDAGVVTVFGWYYLYDDKPEVVEGDATTGSWTVNGVLYPRSISDLYGDAFAVNLSRACTTFTTTIGLSDRSSSRSISGTKLYADSVEKYSRNSIGLGQAYPVQFDLTGALRLRFTRTGDGTLVYGDARVRCAF